MLTGHGGERAVQLLGPAVAGDLVDALAHPAIAVEQECLAQLGYDEHFYRLWEFYLCYCEGGFMERTIGTAQLLLAKPAARPAPLLGNFDA